MNYGKDCRPQCINKDKIRTGFEIHDCPNMKRDPEDRSMDTEHYKCDVCGRHDWLDYEEMR